MADQVVDVLKAKYLVSPVRFEGMQRFETLEIPVEALREIIYNAIAHKNYMGPAIQMHVYDDRIEIWNDGNLPDGYTEDTLYSSHPSLPRNPKIANAMFKAGFIDTWGRGYKKIYTGFKNSGLPIPTVKNHFSGVQIVIERTVFRQLNNSGVNSGVNNGVNNVGRNVGNTNRSKMAERYESILELIKENSFITAAQLSEKLSIPHRTVQRYLANMQKLGLLIREGDRNGGRWLAVK